MPASSGGTNVDTAQLAKSVDEISDLAKGSSNSQSRLDTIQKQLEALTDTVNKLAAGKAS